MKCKRASQAANEITCAPLNINGVLLHRFACVIGECKDCNSKYEPIEFEKMCNEKTKYVLYSPTLQCTWHGDGYEQLKVHNLAVALDVMPCQRRRRMGKEGRRSQQR